MIDATACHETVSILEAIVLGAGEACVDLSLPSLLGGIALFVGSVVLLRFVGARLLRRVLPSRQRAEGDRLAESADPPDGAGRPLAYESPIRSTGAWGGKAR